MPLFKNTSKRKIRILHQGRRIVISPGETIDGPDFFKSYKGLTKQADVPPPPPKPPEPKADPLEEISVNEISEPKESVIIEDISTEENKVEKAKNKTNVIHYEVLKEPKKMNTLGKIDLSDVTFTIPLSIESEDRKNNLTLILDYFGKHFDTNVIVCESGKNIKVKDFWKPEWASYVKCLFMENKTDFFYKTRILNKMAKFAKTPIIASYDSDVLLYPERYLKAAETIRNGTYDFCYPFDKPLKHIFKKDFKTIRETLNLESIEDVAGIIHQGIPPGGCFFMNREKFIEGGMENENMISWGPEDSERLERMRILGYKVGSLSGYLYHVDHLITHNSTYSNPLYRHNVREFEKVTRMNRNQLRDYVNTWSHINE